MEKFDLHKMKLASLVIKIKSDDVTIVKNRYGAVNIKIPSDVVVLPWRSRKESFLYFQEMRDAE